MGLTTLLGLWAVTTPARAQSLVRPVNLAYLAQRADIIVQGRVASVRYEGLPGYEHIPTVLVMLDVERMLRGPGGKQFTFRQFLGRGDVGGGKRGYLAGQRLLLFLPAPSSAGLSSPIGHEQGRFHIVADARGNEMIANEYGNAGLLKAVPETAQKSGVALGGSALRAASAGQGPMPLGDFLSLVGQLMALPRIE